MLAAFFARTLNDVAERPRVENFRPYDRLYAAMNDVPLEHRGMKPLIQLRGDLTLPATGDARYPA